MKRSYWYVVSAVLFFLVFSPVSVYANLDTIGIEIEGTCPVYGDDRTPAREGAIGNSMRKAVERVVGMLVPEGVVAEHADILADTIYPRYKDYIHDYRILREDMADGLYRIRVRVTLSVMDIRRDLEEQGVLTGKWWPEDDTAAVIGIVVREIKRYDDFKTLRETLEKDIRGVDAVHLRRMGSGVAMMHVEMKGDASMLAGELQSKKFRGFSLYVAQITPDTIEINLVKEREIDR